MVGHTRFNATSRRIRTVSIVAAAKSKRPALEPSGRPLRGAMHPVDLTVSAFCTRRVTTHDLVFEIGRLSAISTTSPILYSPFSSCAWYLLERATILP